MDRQWHKSTLSAQTNCVEVWHKSTYSGVNACVEMWRKSTRSGTKECVEVGMEDEEIHVRDSKDRDGPVLVFTGKEWDAFLAGVKAGEFDRKLIVGRAAAGTGYKWGGEEELMTAGHAFIAEFEREFGPVPEEVLAEVQRNWRKATRSGTNAAGVKDGEFDLQQKGSA